MKYKTKQFTTRHHFTTSNRLPHLRSREFRVEYIRDNRITIPLDEAIDSRARVHLITKTKNYKEHRVQRRAKCIITGRNRSVSGRYTVSRIQLKHISNRGQMFGARKSSW